MKQMNKQLNIPINFIEKLYKIIYSIKLNMNLHVVFLLNVWKKQKMNLFYECE